MNILKKPLNHTTFKRDYSCICNHSRCTNLSISSHIGICESHFDLYWKWVPTKLGQFLFPKSRQKEQKFNFEEVTPPAGSWR